jgi:hypothetical protein
MVVRRRLWRGMQEEMDLHSVPNDSRLKDVFNAYAVMTDTPNCIVVPIFLF